MRAPRWPPADGLGGAARLEESRGTGSEQEVPAEAGAQDRALAPEGHYVGWSQSLDLKLQISHLPGEGLGAGLFRD